LSAREKTVDSDILGNIKRPMKNAKDVDVAIILEQAGNSEEKWGRVHISGVHSPGKLALVVLMVCLYWVDAPRIPKSSQYDP